MQINYCILDITYIYLSLCYWLEFGYKELQIVYAREHYFIIGDRAENQS